MKRFMQDEHGHDHSAVTHSAGCDEQGCDYQAKTHAHDDEMAALALSHDLAEHNKVEHELETDPEKIKEAVKAKMQKHS